MKKTIGLIAYIVFVFLLAIQSIYEEQEFLSGGRRVEEEIHRVVIRQYVFRQVGNLGAVFVVTSLILYVRLRRMESRVTLLEQATQNFFVEQTQVGNAGFALRPLSEEERAWFKSG